PWAKAVRARGEYGWWSLYQQKPVPRDGGLFKATWFEGKVIELDQVGEGDTCRGWDLAYSESDDAAFTQGCKMRLCRDGRLVILDYRGGQLSPDKMIRLIVAATQADGYACEQDIPQDPAAGAVLKALLTKELHGYRFQFSPERGDKASRAAPLAAQA